MVVLLKALRNFLARDVIYLLGGFCVLLSLMFIINEHYPFGEESKAIWIFFLGISYIIGFSVQELFCFIRLVTTSALFKPEPVVRVLYRLYMREKWQPTEDFDQYSASVKISEAKLSHQTLNELEWIRCVLLLTATMGSCGLSSGLMVGLKSLSIDYQQAFYLSIPICLLGLVLIATNRVKAAQYRRSIYTLYSLNKGRGGQK